MERSATLDRIAQPAALDGRVEIAAALDVIDDFLESHPEIKASSEDLAVPRSCRAQFYDALADARSRMVRCVIGDQAAKAQLAIDGLSEARQRLASALGLARIQLPSSLQAYCDNPFLGSSQPLLSSLLSYVQGNLGRDELLQAMALTTKAAFEQFSLAAYEAWMAYEAILLTNPRKAWAVAMTGDKKARAVPTRSLEMGQQHYDVAARIPEFVFECEDGLHGVKFELASEIDFYDSKPQRRRDFSSGGDSRGLVGRRYLLAYRLSSLDSIPVVADRDREYVLAPHALFGVIRSADIDKSVYALGTIARVRTLSPRKGAFFLALDGCADRFSRMAADHGVVVQARDATLGGEDALPFANLLKAPSKIGANHEEAL